MCCFCNGWNSSCCIRRRLNQAYQDGYGQGYHRGYDEGWQRGFDQGYQEGRNQDSCNSCSSCASSASFASGTCSLWGTGCGWTRSTDCGSCSQNGSCS